MPDLVGGSAPAAPARKRRLVRRLLRGTVVGCVVYLTPVLSGCMNLSTPVDYVMNLGTFSHDPALKAKADGTRRLVVLRHGLWRSAGSMWKLERALKDHGYEVLNSSYPSTSGHIEDHAAMLRAELDAALATSDGRPLELFFVGHSMGGLQIRYHLSTPGARRPDACVFIATPHRGAALTDKRKDWLLFRWFLGTEAALQLSPSHPFYQSLRPLTCDAGVIYGSRGDSEGHNEDIPGDDDGTVGIEEAQLPEANDKVRLALGHTSLSFADSSIRQVLHYLKHRRFAHGERK
jgi:pimeloyl-ACP methyl ester carboxylesterase